LESSKAGSFLFLKEVIEGLADIIDPDGLSASSRSQWDPVIWLEIVAIVGREFVADVFRLRLTALVVLARVEKPAVLAAMHVRAAMGTLIAVPYFGDDLYFAPAVMTDHIAPRFRARRC
jgi:hypothetical protein